jgi:uncharacterized protein YgiM (DUF1202 family)
MSAYRCSYPDPLRLEPGDAVTIGDRQSDSPGWIWCTDQRGKSGWIPQAYVRREGDKGRLVVSYDATELSADQGEVVEVLKEESGWAWCRKQNGRHGWLPVESLD